MLNRKFSTALTLLALSGAPIANAAITSNETSLAREVVTASSMAFDAIQGAKLGAAAGLDDGRYTPASLKCFIELLPEDKVKEVVAEVLAARFPSEQLQAANTFYRSEAGQLAVKMSHRKFLLSVGASAPAFNDIVTSAHIDTVRRFKATEVGQELMELTSPTMRDVTRSVNAVLLQHYDSCAQRKSRPAT
jgi:hypothetical protein